MTGSFTFIPTPNTRPKCPDCPKCSNCTKCVVDDVLAPCFTGVCDVIASRLHRPLNNCCNCGENKCNKKTPLLVRDMYRFKKYTKRKSSKKYSKKYSKKSSKKSKKKSSKKSVRKNKL